MREPSRSIQHSSTPALRAGAKLGCRVELFQPAGITAKSSHSESYRTPDNYFRPARFYLSEHRLCSLHLGSFGSPFFDPVVSGQRSVASKMNQVLLATGHWPPTTAF